MATGFSPLRYPGGKQILANVLAHLLRINGSQEGVYAEPFAGGAGAALALLFGEHVRQILINDADRQVFAFWKAVLEEPSSFLKLLRRTPLTMAEWRRQRNIYQNPQHYPLVRAGFATFYLNRCNRSGIIASGGPIGGVEQKGKWRLDARFNREELARRIQRIASFRDRIRISNLDAIEFLRRRVARAKGPRPVFVYLDPPYFAKGQHLYLSYYKAKDHARLASYLTTGEVPFRWVLTYDDAAQIKALYGGQRIVRFDLAYSATERRSGKELLIAQDGLTLPTNWKTRIPPGSIGLSVKLS